MTFISKRQRQHPGARRVRRMVERDRMKLVPLVLAAVLSDGDADDKARSIRGMINRAADRSASAQVQQRQATGRRRRRGD